MGWPSADTVKHGAAVAGVDELQQFWTEVGCVVFGKYTTFWYELLRDSTPDQKADWGLIDVSSRKPRINNLSCGAPEQSLPAVPPANSQLGPQPSSLASNGLTGFKAPSRSTVSPIQPSLDVQPSLAKSQFSVSKAEPSTMFTTVFETTTITPQPIIPPTPNIWSNASLTTIIVTKTSTKLITVQPPFTRKVNSERPLLIPTTVGLPGVCSLKP
jgi:glucan endo-1,3-beta-D-glucosidase